MATQQTVLNGAGPPPVAGMVGGMVPPAGFIPPRGLPPPGLPPPTTTVIAPQNTSNLPTGPPGSGPPGSDPSNNNNTLSDAPPGGDFDAPGSDGGVDISAAGALNHTIYVHNLNEKVTTLELKRSLYGVFKRFGKILDIQARKTYFLRGQAWIIFDSIEAAKNAVVQMQGFPLFDKSMRIAFATATSDVIAKGQGTYRKRPKRKRKVPAPSVKKAQLQSQQQTVVTSSTSTTSSSSSVGSDSVAPNRKRPANVVQQQLTILAPPHNVLVATQLPDDCSKEMLEELFKQNSGFLSVRYFNVKHAAFIQFQTVPDATVALQRLSVSSSSMSRITYLLVCGGVFVPSFNA